ncbi:MAG: AAA family ATPase, partial [Coriobacteriales bacterium]|nr:AAA family ATPase [Coriobacteriales bacterium]
MLLTRIELTNFRNHQHLVLDKIGSVLIIVGNNAAGKTNIVEALQLLSMHESFRRPKNEELFFKQRSTGAITSITLDVFAHDTTNTKKITFVENTRTFTYNKKERPARQLSDLIPSVLFTPDDLQIIKGPPEQRRDLLDSLGARLSGSFAYIRAEYYKALRHKNSLLKQEEVDVALLDSWNVNLAKLGASLSKHRAGLFEQLLQETAAAYNKISGGEVLAGSYKTSEAEEADSPVITAQPPSRSREALCRSREGGNPYPVTPVTPPVILSSPPVILSSPPDILSEAKDPSSSAQDDRSVNAQDDKVWVPAFAGTTERFAGTRGGLGRYDRRICFLCL